MTTQEEIRLKFTDQFLRKLAARLTTAIEFKKSSFPTQQTHG